MEYFRKRLREKCETNRDTKRTTVGFDRLLSHPFIMPLKAGRFLHHALKTPMKPQLIRIINGLC